VASQPLATPAPPLSQSPSKRPSRIPGAFAAGAGFLVPDTIRNKFRNGWVVHIPLTYLTNKYCAYKKSATVFHDSLSIDEMSGHIVTASKPLSDAGELDLTFEEWHQAWRRLLPLIREFLPDDYDAWNSHFLTIRDKETLADCWRLWLAYDTEICRRSVHEGIDPAVHHISVWNDLEIRYMEDKIAHRFRSELANFRSQNSPHFHPYSRDHNMQPPQPPRSHSFRARYPEHDKSQMVGKFFICGDPTRSHISRNCISTTLANGKPCHLQRPSPSEPRKDKNDRQYCFAWNGFTGCKPGPRCGHGEHLCTLCGASSHNAQHCSV
jgi:hypothetical protein